MYRAIPSLLQQDRKMRQSCHVSSNSSPWRHVKLLALCGSLMMLSSCKAVDARKMQSDVVAMITTSDEDGIRLDGDLSDWTEEYSLMFLPRLKVDGHMLYGKRTPEAVFLAITSTIMTIGQGSTVWLNTDANETSGFQVWEDKIGAEYNVNIDADGFPYLYQGSAAEQFIFGPLQHAYSDDQMTLELKIPSSLLGNLESSSIDMALDINNEVFLPPSFEGHYVVPFAFVPSKTDEKIQLDGDLSDWSEKNSLMMLPHLKVDGFELYGKHNSEAIFVAIATSTDTTIGPGSTVWLNTDANEKSGFQVWGDKIGAEYNINIDADGSPYLYQGSAAEILVQGPLEHAYDGDRKTIEVKIPTNLLGNVISSSIELALDINNEIFLPTALKATYTVYAAAAHVGSSSSVRVGIVHSNTSLNGFYSKKNYAQLFMAAQHQATMAGIPFDLLSEESLLDIANVHHYNAIIIPHFNFVRRSYLHRIEDTLLQAVYVHKVGLIVSGDLMIADEDGIEFFANPYRRMNDLMDIDFQRYGKAENRIRFYAKSATHPVMSDYEKGEDVLSYESQEFSFTLYQGYNHEPEALVNQKVDESEDGEASYLSTGTSYQRADTSNEDDGVVLVTQTGGRNVHFSSHRVCGDSNLLWSVIQYVVFGSERPAIGIKLTRNRNLFLARNDMDLAMYPHTDDSVKLPVLSLLQQWKKDYNFVGSYYIDIGNNKDAGEYTDWDKNRPIYFDYMALGNEIGTHSYTHPHYISKLSTEELEFEFNQSCRVLTTEIDLQLCGSALPGNPESLSVDEELNAVHLALNAYLPYVSGEYSGEGAGFKGAFGFISPEYEMMYFSPNMLFDFTMIEFYGWDHERSLNKWLSQYEDLNRHAAQPIIHWPWHDYVVLKGTYNLKMFTGLISVARQSNAEFATTKDAYFRILDMKEAELHYEELQGGKFLVTVIGGAFGKMALRVHSGYSIMAVKNWYAYSDEMIFLPRGGGSFEIDVIGTSQNAHIRIVEMPMRAELITVEQSDGSFKFEFEGEGEVTIMIPESFNVNVPHNREFSFSPEGDFLKLQFDDFSVHTVELPYELSGRAKMQSDSVHRLSNVSKLLIFACIAVMIVWSLYIVYLIESKRRSHQRARIIKETLNDKHNIDVDVAEDFTFGSLPHKPECTCELCIDDARPQII